MNLVSFKGTHFAKDVILHAVFFYLRYSISYRDLEEIMAERGADLDHATLTRCIGTSITRDTEEGMLGGVNVCVDSVLHDWDPVQIAREGIAQGSHQKGWQLALPRLRGIPSHRYTFGVPDIRRQTAERSFFCEIVATKKNCLKL